MYYIKCTEDYGDGQYNITLYGKRFSFYSNMVKEKDKDKITKEMKSIIETNGFEDVLKAKSMLSALKKDLRSCKIELEEI